MIFIRTLLAFWEDQFYTRRTKTKPFFRPETAPDRPGSPAPRPYVIFSVIA